MTRSVLRLLVLIAALAGLPLAAARADVTVDVNQGILQPMPIALPSFTGAGPFANDIVGVVSADLARSGLFRPLDQNLFADKAPDVNIPPNYANWKQIGAQALVVGQVTPTPDGRLQVDFHLFDIFAQKEMSEGVRFTASPDAWRHVAHKIADVVYERLTGEKGYFDSQVVFVSESGPKTHRLTRLTLMDQDGYNPTFLTDGAEEVMTPRFSSTSREITYVVLRDTGSTVYLFNLDTGRRESLGHYAGMVFAPRFSPDGSKVAFSVEQAGNSDVFVMDLHSRTTQRLTTDPSIDTSPSFSPDGSQIVFNSDRGGSPELYVMGAGGGGQHRISFGDGRYTDPVWSPTGDMIAFVKQTGSTFHIGVMKPDGSGERILTTSYLDEGPTWAPNGRVIMFSREGGGGGPKLWTVDITGQVSQAVPNTGAASDPAWSPLLN